MLCEDSCAAKNATEPANDNSKNFLELVRFHTILNKYSGLLYAKNIVAKSDNINYKLEATSYLKSQKPELIGSTFLHIAAYHCGYSSIKFLLKCGADLTLKNDNGCTALIYRCLKALEDDLRLLPYKKRGRFDCDEVNLMLSAHVETNNYTNPCNEDEFSHFHIACMANNTKAVELFLNNGVSIDQVVSRNSPVYPGYTPLHFAAKFCCSETVELLLKHGANMYITDASGMTPLHVLINEKIDIAENIHSRNKKRSLRSERMIRPIEKITKLFLSYDNVDDLNVVGRLGLSHFHVACTMSEITMVEHFLEHGKIDVNRSIDAGSPMRPGYTGLHLASHFDIGVVMLLLANGADVHVTDTNGLTPYDLCLRNFEKSDVDALLPARINDESTPAESETSTTRSAPAPLTCKIFYQDGYSQLPELHVLCNNYEIDAIRELLARGDVDVNARASSSSVWPGCTALHILVSFTSVNSSLNDQKQNETSLIAQLLLDHGADVTLTDDKLCTPVHVADMAVTEGYFINKDVYNYFYHRVRLLLRYQKNFKINPVDSRGISHFHIACRMNEVAVVEHFLNDNDIDVNRMIDYFSDDLPGCTPIHLAASSYAKCLVGDEVQMQTIELLLKRGADVCVLDSYGNNPLHGAAKHGPARERVFEVLTSKGADINAVNILGETPLEVLLKSGNVTTEEVEFFRSHGYRTNFYNSINHKGYVSINFSKEYHQSLQSTAFQAMIHHSSVTEADEYGRTIIHNLVSTGTPIVSVEEYASLIKSMEAYCDIDDQDTQGRTALHYAAQFENERAVEALLSLGADIDLIDVNEEVAFTYSMYDRHFMRIDEAFPREHGNGYTEQAFTDHLRKLLFRNLDVSPKNLKVARETMIQCMTYTTKATYMKEVEKAKNVKIGSSSIVLYDFLSETGAVAAYPIITQDVRAMVDEFFQAIDELGFEQITGVVKRQYRKALARVPLMDSARDSLRILVDFPLPDVCCKVIFRFLKNSEVANLIASTNEDLC